MDKNRYKQQFYDDLKKIAVDIIKQNWIKILIVKRKHPAKGAF